MNHIILNAVLAALQPWSPAQQEIIDTIKRCNDAWVASIAQNRFDVYDSACPATDRAVFWYTASETPVTYKGPEGLWAFAAKQNRAVSWRDLETLGVQVDGDVAYIYYSVTWTAEPNAGGVVHKPSRRLTVFQRRNGRWLMAAGSVAHVMQ